jgi:chloramphenicol-sensitive protein RarD
VTSSTEQTRGLPRHSAAEIEPATVGLWHAVLAYGLWGLVPIYWKLLQNVPAFQLICHRIVWSCVLLLGLIFFAPTVRLTTSAKATRLRLATAWSRQSSPASRERRRTAVKKADTTYDRFADDRHVLWKALRSPRAMGIYTAAALVIGINWFVYVWAVNSGFIVQSSLGYFINPLVNVLLGVVVFRERLRRLQWVAIGLAASGVLYLTILYGSVPWIALALAVSFGMYGLLKKMGPLGSIQGLALETTILFVPALAYLVFVERADTGGFLHASVTAQLLMAAAGPVTTVPLLFFGSAARRIPLSLMGMLQYISPTVQFLLGVLVYKESFSAVQSVGFGLVWTALVLLAVEGYVTRRWPALGVAEVP